MFILFDDYIFFSSFLVKKPITAKNPLTPRNLIVNVKLPRPSSLQLGIEVSGKTMGARGLMGNLKGCDVSTIQ
jgi:hypothetical protein